MQLERGAHDWRLADGQRGPVRVRHPGPTLTAAPSAARPTVPPLSTTAWTGLTVTALAGAPTSIVNLFRWSGGYLAISQPNPDAQETAWLSTDGREWTQLPARDHGPG